MHRPPAATAEPRRILVVRNRFVGDTMLAVPFLRNLRRRFPAATIDVLCESGAATLLADCPYTDELLQWRRPPRVGRVVRGSFANVVANARWISARRYDRAYLLKRSLSSTLLAWLAGIPCRIGFRSFGSGLLSRSVPVTPFRHQAELFLDLLRCDDIAVDDGRNESCTTKAAIAKAEALLAGTDPSRPRVFIAPQSTDVHRLWPWERFSQLIDRLVAERGCDVFFCGGPRDVTVYEQILRLSAAATRRHVHDHSADLSLSDVGGLFARMDLCIGVDSGLNHIAAANGVPVVVLAGPTDPNRWHPWRTRTAVVKAPPSGLGRLRGWLRERLGGPRHLPWDPEPGSMQAISVERVLEAVEDVLPRLSGPPPETLPLRVLDLRHDSHRYEVWESPRPAAAAVPATKPLAHAH